MAGLSAAAVLMTLFHVVLSQGPQIRVHNGHIDVQQNAFSNTPILNYVQGQSYTFEMYMVDTQNSDYMIESCTMNGEQFIGAFGCVQCGSGVINSVETEQYTRPGAMKRTLVHFYASSPNIQFACSVKVLQCCGCAERSCERRPLLLGVACTARSIIFGAVGDHYPPTSLEEVFEISHSWPWWLWMLLGLLLLLLILCCIAACLLAFCNKKKGKTMTNMPTSADEKQISGARVDTGSTTVQEMGVGTGNVNRYSTSDSNNQKIISTVEGSERVSITNQEERQKRYETRESGSAGFYSVREGKTREKLHMKSPVNGSEPTDFCERASYRNFAYERDMGKVAPLEGFDEVETRERRYCLSDDEYDIIEKDIKRTHTSRFYQDSCHMDNGSESGSERFREEDIQHAVYAQSLPV